MTDHVKELKFVVVGDDGVGKTALLTRFTNPDASSEFLPTIFENQQHMFNYEDKELLLDLWDSAGSGNFDRLRPLLYKNVDVCIIIFSLADFRSFENANYKWLPEIETYGAEAERILVGNKSDLEKSDDITKVKIDRLMQKGKFSEYVETDILGNKNVREVFEAGASSIVDAQEFSRLARQNSLQLFNYKPTALDYPVIVHPTSSGCKLTFCECYNSGWLAFMKKWVKSEKYVVFSRIFIAFQTGLDHWSDLLLAVAWLSSGHVVWFTLWCICVGFSTILPAIVIFFIQNNIILSVAMFTGFGMVALLTEVIFLDQGSHVRQHRMKLVDIERSYWSTEYAKRRIIMYGLKMVDLRKEIEKYKDFDDTQIGADLLHESKGEGELPDAGNIGTNYTSHAAVSYQEQKFECPESLCCGCFTFHRALETKEFDQETLRAKKEADHAGETHETKRKLLQAIMEDYKTQMNESILQFDEDMKKFDAGSEELRESDIQDLLKQFRRNPFPVGAKPESDTDEIRGNEIFFETSGYSDKITSVMTGFYWKRLELVELDRQLSSVTLEINLPEIYKLWELSFESLPQLFLQFYVLLRGMLETDDILGLTGDQVLSISLTLSFLSNVASTIKLFDPRGLRDLSMISLFAILDTIGRGGTATLPLSNMDNNTFVIVILASFGLINSCASKCQDVLPRYRGTTFCSTHGGIIFNARGTIGECTSSFRSVPGPWMNGVMAGSLSFFQRDMGKQFIFRRIKTFGYRKC